MAASGSHRLTVVVEGVDLPGRSCDPAPGRGRYENIHVGLCVRGARAEGLAVEGRPWKVAEPVPGDASSARWQFEIAVKELGDGLDFGGPYVRGNKDDRHIGLAWGELSDAGAFDLFRGVKLRLEDVGAGVIEDASRPGSVLVGRLGLTDAKGHPRCASVRPPAITWTAERTDASSHP